MKSGFVSLIGRPNVGKSTLLNTLVNSSVAITSDKPGTTRNIIQGVLTDESHQLIFVDTPGIHKPINRLGKVLNKQARGFVDDIDVILFVVDAMNGLGKGDKFILETLKYTESPVILVLNKVDSLSKEEVYQRIDEYKDLYPFAEIVPVSALKNKNVDRLLSVTKNYLKHDIRYFEPHIKTTSSKYFMISEYVREKLLQITEEEIPHRITCITSHFEEKEKIANIVVDIIVDRDSLKKIIIGKKGDRLKQVGTLARADIENLLGKKVYLELFVKTMKDWRNKEKFLTELGFKEHE